MLKDRKNLFLPFYTILMHFNVYSYTFYKNKDKIKEIQVALRSLQLRKKERNERNYFNRCSHGNVCLWFLYHG